MSQEIEQNMCWRTLLSDARSTNRRCKVYSILTESGEIFVEIEIKRLASYEKREIVTAKTLYTWYSFDLLLALMSDLGNSKLIVNKILEVANDLRVDKQLTVDELTWTR